MAALRRQPPLALAAALVATAGLAAVSAQHVAFAQAQAANQAAMREYTWKSRTELKLNGETKKVTLEQMRFDLDGRLQKTTIGGSPVEASGLSGRGRAGGPIRQRIIEHKREEFKELMQDLARLVGSYQHLPQAKLLTFTRQVPIAAGVGTDTGPVRLFGENLLEAGDSMRVLIDPASFMIRRVEIATRLENCPVDVVADYRTLDNGLTYQARAMVRYPADRSRSRSRASNTTTWGCRDDYTTTDRSSSPARRADDGGVAGAGVARRDSRGGAGRNAAGRSGWPRTYTTATGARVQIYQPQIVSWEGQTHLVAYAAVSYEANGTGKPALGTIKVEAETSVAIGERLVSLAALRISEASFGSLGRDKTRAIIAEIVSARFQTASR